MSLSLPVETSAVPAALRRFLRYGAVIALGVGAGLALLPWLQRPYSEGNFQQYFPDNETTALIYRIPQCALCDDAKALFDARHIVYVERDLSASPQWAEEFRGLGAKAVPLILLRERKFEGFDATAIDDTLNEYRLLDAP